MNNCSILNIRIITNCDSIHISTNHCIKPNRAVITHCNLPYHNGIFRQKAIVTKYRRKAPYCFYDCHNLPLYYLLNDLQLTEIPDKMSLEKTKCVKFAS